MYKPLPHYIAIGPSNIDGAGLIAQEDIPAEVEIGITHIYDPSFEDDSIRTPLGGFINHSENPNCEFVSDVDDIDYTKLKTLRRIDALEELTCRYTKDNPVKGYNKDI